MYEELWQLGCAGAASLSIITISVDKNTLPLPARQDSFRDISLHLARFHKHLEVLIISGVYPVGMLSSVDLVVDHRSC